MQAIVACAYPHVTPTWCQAGALWSTGALLWSCSLGLAPFVHQTMGVFSSVARPAVNTFKYMVCALELYES